MLCNEPLSTNRRTFIAYLGTLTLGGLQLAPRLHALPPLRRLPGVLDGQDAASEALDEALEILTPYGPSFRGGLSNHGPMAAEALVSLGHPGAVIPWVERYRRRLEAQPAASDPIGAEEWQQALGKSARIGDWNVRFTKELAEDTWQNVVGRWVPRLAPGIAAAGLHGVIRAGHAVASLTAKATPLRVDELARALAYWASEYLELPGTSTAFGTLAPAEALAKVELLPREQRTSRGLITTELRDLVGFAAFKDVVGFADPTAGSPDFLTDLIGTFAGTFVHARSRSFEFLHAVTGSAAVVELLPHVDEKQRARVLAYTWQATAALYARFGEKALLADVQPVETDHAERDAKLAAESGDAHTIKLVAACARQWKRHADPRLMAATARRLH